MLPSRLTGPRALREIEPMVYRGRDADPGPRAARNDVLDEIVHQFADTYAFVRELVQNAIDAGATRIRLLVDERDGDVFTSVEDDGSGMTLDVLEGPLLTAFSSGKEGKEGEGKIGKYGVGFLSVFARAPARVVVATSTGTEAHDVVVLPDHTYTIEPRPSTRRGTTVTLVSRAGAVSREEQAKRVAEAARRWCPHVRVPIDLVVDGGPPERLTTPFAIDTPVAVEGERDGVRAVVGVAAPDLAAASFFHSGLLLHETSSSPPAIPFVVFKVESTRFEHTISRDGVRVDKAYRAAIELVEDLVDGALRPALITAIEALPNADASEASFARAAAIVAAAVRLLPRRKIALPLAAVSAGSKRSIRLADVDDVPPASLFTASSPGLLADVLTAAGAIVLRDDARGTVRALLPLHARPVERATVLVRTDVDAALASDVAAALETAGVAFDRVSLCDVLGAAPAFATRILGPETKASQGFSAWPILDAAPVAPGGREVVLVASAPSISRARVASDRRAAAALVARLVLAESGLSNPSSSDRLLRWAAEEAAS